MRERKLLCRTTGAFTRDAIFQTDEALEIDSSEQLEVVRRRVFFDDVMMVTLHSERGAAYLFVTAAFGGLFTFFGLLILNISLDAWPATLMFFVLGIPADLMFLARLVFGRNVITVFGRRSKAVLRFGSFRGERARDVYGRICAAVRRAQAMSAPAAAAPEAPLPEGVPMPPPM